MYLLISLTRDLEITLSLSCGPGSSGFMTPEPICGQETRTKAQKALRRHLSGSLFQTLRGLSPLSSHIFFLLAH